ncbi:MAG TPA: BamA/TamA family outer membrane protein [Polyangiaceae bacterium]|nr:BamA/TamA family outer membrane protein [Polyangiaceae bacterium]
MKRCRLHVALVLLLATALAPRAHAGEEYSEYEQKTIDAALREENAEIEPNPEGKRIEDIRFITLDVIEERDPYPRFFNIFHATTRPYVVERQLTFRRGEIYDQRRVDESARALRGARQLSLVLIVPMQGTYDETIKLLVITKDVWSLRLNTNFEATDGRLTRLLLQPAEENVLGTHTMVGGLFVLEPATYSLGAQFIDRRVAGSRIQGIVSANLIFNRDSGSAEGSFGSFAYGTSLFSSETEWAWRTLVTWRQEVFRSFIGADQRTFDAAITPADDRIPYEYDSSRYYGAYLLTRSFGRRLKNDLSFGLEVDHRKAKPTQLSGADPLAAREFVATELPVNDTRFSPLLQARSYTSDYSRVLDFETLGLQEDYRVGHELVFRVYPAFRDVASSRSMLGTFAAAGYTAPFGDGLLRAIVSNTLELSSQEQTDALASANIRVVTPRIGLGRIVYDSVLLNRYENYLNERFTIGGGTRLRGYPPQAFLGKDVVASNLEFRTTPVEILRSQVGAAFFYDVGDAFDGADDLRLKQSVGLGLRALIPQANRIVFRADYKLPVVAGRAVGPGSLFLTFGQAFGVPTVTPPTLASDFLD